MCIGSNFVIVTSGTISYELCKMGWLISSKSGTGARVQMTDSLNTDPELCKCYCNIGNDR